MSLIVLIIQGGNVYTAHFSFFLSHSFLSPFGMLIIKNNPFNPACVAQ